MFKLLSEEERQKFGPHKWAIVNLGHSNRVCTYCAGTPNEIAVIGDMNHCEKNPITTQEQAGVEAMEPLLQEAFSEGRTFKEAARYVCERQPQITKLPKVQAEFYLKLDPAGHGTTSVPIHSVQWSDDRSELTVQLDYWPEPQAARLTEKDKQHVEWLKRICEGAGKGSLPKNVDARSVLYVVGIIERFTAAPAQQVTITDIASCICVRPSDEPGCIDTASVFESADAIMSLLAERGLVKESE